MVPDPVTNQLVTAHPHFEGRCVVEPMPADFRERLEAYMVGGWPEWEAVKRRQAAHA